MNTANILIIEDEKDLADAISTALTYEGYTVHTAEDGQRGLAVALHEKPDLILLDMVMPKMGGLEVLKSLRSDAWGKGVKIIVMTALDDLNTMAEVVDAGGDEYIVKSSVNLSSIVQKVKDKLSQATQ